MTSIERLRRMRKWLLTSTVALFLLAMGTCYFGVEHEIQKIPPEVRAKIVDPDWIGVEWIMRSMAIDAVALLLLLSVAALWLYERRTISHSDENAGS